MKTGLESLDTGAPNITYSGNEGPKSPQEMQQMASAPDPMDERNNLMEMMSEKYYGKPLKDLTDEEIIEIEEMMNEMDPYGKKPTAPNIRMAEFDMKEYMEEFERVFPEMKNKRGTPEYDRDLEEYFQGLASKQGGIGNMASNDQNTIILERLYEKYLEMGLSLEEAKDAAIKEMENMQDDFSSAPEGIRSTMAAQGGRIGFQFGGGSGEKAFSKEENLKRFEAAKRLAKEKGISLQEALDITLSDSYRIEEAQGGRIEKADGGVMQLVKENEDGSRPGYRGPGGYQGSRSSSAREAGASASRSRQTSSPRSSDPTTRDENRREQYAVARTQNIAPTPIEPAYEMSGGQKFSVGDPRIAEAKNIIEQPKSDFNILDFIPGIGTARRLASMVGTVDNKAFFKEKVLTGRNLQGYDEDDYEEYMAARMAGIIDAYGNPTDRGIGGSDQRIDSPTQIAMTPTSITTDLDTLETETPETKDFVKNRFAPINPALYDFPDYIGGIEVPAADGGRIGYAGGGITDLRQGYFLGKLVKKATRGIKKLIKSPIGKAALLAGGSGLFGQYKAGTGLGNTIKNILLGKLTRTPGPPNQMMTRAGGLFNFLKTPKGAMTGIAALSSLPLLFGQEQEDDDLDAVTRQALRGQGLDIPGIRKLALAGNLDRSMFPFMNPSFYAADGGRIGLAEGLTPRQAALSAMYGENNDDEDEIKELALGGSAGMPPITQGTEGQISQSFSDDETPMPTQPDQMPRMNPMMARGMNPMMARGMNPMMARGMNPMMNRGMMSMQQPRIMAQEGGMMDMGGMEKDYRNEGGFVPIGGQERADDVPARLSKNEFVFTADAVRNAGGGDIDKGAEIMENMMENLEQGGKVSKASQGLSGAREMFATQQRLEEVL